MSEVAYPGLTVAEKIVKALWWDNMIAGFSASVSGFFAPLVNYVMTWIGDRLYAFLCKIIDMTAIPFVNQALRTALNNELPRLKLIAEADPDGVDSEEFKKERAIASKDFKRFTHYGAVG
jgi:hypothetical protein